MKTVCLENNEIKLMSQNRFKNEAHHCFIVIKILRLN